MPAVGLIDKYARSFIASALRQGYALDDVCAAAGVEQATYRSQEQLFGPKELASISRHVKRLMDDEFCGFARRRCKAGTLQLALELVLPSKTLEEALDKAFRLYSVISDDVQFDLITEADYADIRVHIMEPELDQSNFLAEWFLLLWRSLSGWLIGEEIPVLKTRFEHPREGVYDEYTQAFGSDCAFRQADNSITFHGRYLRQPVVKDLSDLRDFYSTTYIDLTNYSGVDRALKTRIRALLKDYFFEAQKFYPMEAVARKFNMSVQSLRRRLEEEGSSYRNLKEEIRREAAITWLRDERIPISEISRMCGFAETNGLSRAMKSWVGVSPSVYRETVLRERSGSGSQPT